MSSTTGSPADKPPTTRLRLTMPSPTHSANVEGLLAFQASENNPRRPSYSPVTPTYPGGTPDASIRRGNRLDFIDEPHTLPITLDENSDAIALKAALSILQLQKQQSQRDIKQLDRMKAAADREPEAFVDALKAGKLSGAPPQAVLTVGDEHDSDQGTPDNGVADAESSHDTFGKFPKPQNVVRCPAINWAKYHIVGEPLDRIHEEQKQRPEPGSVRRDEYGRPPEHVIAAPYRPFIDKFEPTADITRGESNV